MSAAPILMTAQAGGAALPTSSPLTVTKATRALHIDQRILAQPGLSLTACAILAEVLDLYQVKGKVFADDDHFAARAKCSARTARGELATLEKAGYLSRDVDQRRAGNKRLLVPTDKWQETPVAPAEFAGATPEPLANSAGASGEICHSLRQNLPEPPADSANINTIVNTTTNTIQNPTATAGAGSGDFEKKIGGENPADLPAADEQLVPPVARPPRAKPARPVGPRSHAYDPAAIADNLRLPFASPEFRAAWVGYRTYREEMGYRRLSGGMMEQQQLDKLAGLAAGDEAHALALIAQAIGKGWQDFYPLDKPRFAPSTTHAPSTSHPNRPVNGHKPTGNAGDLAGALFAHLQQQPD